MLLSSGLGRGKAKGRGVRCRRKRRTAVVSLFERGLLSLDQLLQTAL